MMAYIMLYCKKLSVALFLLLTCLLAIADESVLTVDYAELTQQEDSFVLNASLLADFNSVLESAVNKGVPLSFVAEFQIVQPHKYWFDDEVVTTSKRIDLSFHALTRQYLVTKEGHQKSFETLNEAMQDLTEIRNWKVVKKNQLKESVQYQALLLIRLDKKKLPKAIQVDSISSEDWNLATPVYSWTLKEIK
jgi:hypothetical protein